MPLIRSNLAGGSVSVPTKLGDHYSTTLPNLISNITLGSGHHNILIVVGTFNTNISMSGDTPVVATFNGNNVSITEVAFTDESAHDLYVGYIALDGAGTLSAGLNTTASTSGRSSSVQIIEI